MKIQSIFVQYSSQSLFHPSNNKENNRNVLCLTRGGRKNVVGSLHLLLKIEIKSIFFIDCNDNPDPLTLILRISTRRVKKTQIP